MVHKILKVSFAYRCIGCELCVMEAQRQLSKAGLEGSLIRVFKEPTKDTLTFSINMDPHINKLDIQKIKSICPTTVFSVEEVDDPYGFIS